MFQRTATEKWGGGRAGEVMMPNLLVALEFGGGVLQSSSTLLDNLDDNLGG